MKRAPNTFAIMLLAFSALALTMTAGAQEARQAGPASGKKPSAGLDIATMMKGEEFVGTSPSGLAWAVDGKTLYFRWKRPGAERQELYAVTAARPEPRPVKQEELLKLPALRQEAAGRMRTAGFGGFGAEVEFDRDRKRMLVVQNGDLFLVDLQTGKSRQLTALAERKSGASFSFDGKKAVFTMAENLYAISLEDGSIRQLTAFTRQAPPQERQAGEIDKWYADEQRKLFRELQRPPQFGEMMARRGSALPQLPQTPRLKPYFLKDSERVVRLELSPDEKYVLFAVNRRLEDQKTTIVPSYVTRSGYTETIESHAKAAYAEEGTVAGVVRAETGDVTWLDYGQAERRVYPGSAIWSPDGRECLLSARSEDRKDEWLFRLDPATGKTSVVFQVHDEAWVGPFGLANIFFWPDGKRVSFISEKDGYAHLYRANVDGTGLEALTSGKFEVRQAALSKDGKRLYLVTSEEHPGETHFYWMPAEGGRRVRITDLPGLNEVSLSPDETTLAVLNSRTDSPAELYLQPNKPGAPARRITVSTTEAFRAYDWAEPEVVSFPARDGVEVYARLYRPAVQHPARPAVIFIHGAGYLQNAHKGWSTYFREYMFHNLLLEKGYYVLDVDYRGSSGYGRDFRTGIYRHMGGKDLDDIIDAARYLTANHPVDPARIGCYGGSYGGFLTLMAMFKAADVFRAGAALRPVTDWAHYHPGYTVDILNLPHKDPEAYRQSSPIYFAEGLKGALLICHGMVDTNVHFQDSVRLVQRLIELGKENWELAVYPVENHSFTTASAWTDEYKRILKLFETNLKQ